MPNFGHLVISGWDKYETAWSIEPHKNYADNSLKISSIILRKIPKPAYLLKVLLKSCELEKQLGLFT